MQNEKFKMQKAVLPEVQLELSRSHLNFDRTLKIYFARLLNKDQRPKKQLTTNNR